MDASIRIEHQLLAVETEHDVHCMLELDVPTGTEVERAPLHLALVVDRSGSMEGDRLDAARRCAAFLASRLRPSDELALVTYDDEVTVDAPLARVDGPRLQDAIDRIRSGGMTNLSGGWLKGLEELRRAQGDGIRRVLLLTDGLANQGIVDRDQLVQVAQRSAADASTTTIGFGEGFDEDLLGAIADASGASTYFVESPEAAPGIFAEEFDGLTSIVAQNLSVEIRPVDEVELVGVLNDYPSNEVPGGVQVSVGDAFGGEQRRIVFALHLPNLAALGPAKVADVVLRYVDVGELNAHEVTLPVVVNLVRADDAAAADLDQEVTDEVWLLRAARARKEAIEAHDRGDHGGSVRGLRMMVDSLHAAAPESARGLELREEADALAKHVRAAETADPMLRKRLHQEHWSHTHGRKRRDPR